MTPQLSDHPNAADSDFALLLATRCYAGLHLLLHRGAAIRFPQAAPPHHAGSQGRTILSSTVFGSAWPLLDASPSGPASTANAPSLDAPGCTANGGAGRHMRQRMPGMEPADGRRTLTVPHQADGVRTPVDLVPFRALGAQTFWLASGNEPRRAFDLPR
jgi:hypothetical protein